MTGNERERAVSGRELRLTVENVGGVDHAELSFSAGVTLLAGENASNKSSLLRALAGVLGGPTPPLKSDADAGSVRLSVGDDSYGLDLAREGDRTVVTDADPYSTATDRCELFVALTETNPIRRATVAGGDLHELLMRPVDTEQLAADVRRLEAEKERLDDRLAELSAMADRLPGLERRRNSLREELSAVEADLEERRERAERLEADREDDGAAQLRARRDERTDLSERIRTHEDAVDSLEAELASVEDQLASTDGAGDDATVAELAAELDRLHDRKEELTATVNALDPVVDMNARLLGDGEEVPAALTGAAVIDDLDPDGRSVTCWTCGSSVDRAAIAEQVEAVRELVRERRDQRDALTERIRSLTERKRDLERRQEERERLRERRAELREALADREDTLETLRADRRELDAEISELRAAATGDDTDDELAACYDRIGDLEYERGRLAGDLERVAAEIDEIETALADREDLEAERAAVAERLRERRNRVERLERELVGTFNDTMQRLLDTLSYDAVERVWLERRSTGDGVDGTAFDLHVVREGDDGVYEDTVDSLSKSEREVIGLVVAVAGYIAHDVAEEVPIIVVDAVEMLDAERIRGLLEHLSGLADCVVAAVLPEERAELDGTYDALSTSSLEADC